MNAPIGFMRLLFGEAKTHADMLSICAAAHTRYPGVDSLAVFSSQSDPSLADFSSQAHIGAWNFELYDFIYLSADLDGAGASDYVVSFGVHSGFTRLHLFRPDTLALTNLHAEPECTGVAPGEQWVIQVRRCPG